MASSYLILSSSPETVSNHALRTLSEKQPALQEDHPNLGNDGVVDVGKMYHTHWIGRFGNRMFQYAYVCEYARVHASLNIVVYAESTWEGTILFNSSCLAIVNDSLGLLLRAVKDVSNDGNLERSRAFAQYARHNPGWEVPTFWEPQESLIPSFTKSVGGSDILNIWFQSLHMMFASGMHNIMEKGHVAELFHFSKAVRSTKIFRWIYQRRGTYDVAHLRRDDVVGLQEEREKCHNCIITISSYLRAMAKRGVAKADVIWISDDPSLRSEQWWHSDLEKALSAVPGPHWVHPEGEQQIPRYVFAMLPDLLLLVYARRVFRANSGFSFWGAFMNTEPCREIYSPDMTTCVPADTSTSAGVTEYDCDFSAHNRNHWESADSYNQPWDPLLFA